MSDTLNRTTEAARVVSFPKARTTPPIRTEAEALWAIIENADHAGFDGPDTFLMIRATPRLREYLESYGTAPAA